MTAHMAERDPYRYFRVEAADLLERLLEGALAIEKGAAVPGGVAALLRHAHTLKGAARVVRQVELADHAHAIEDLLAPHRDASLAPRELAGRLHGGLDAIAELLGRIDAPTAVATEDGARPDGAPPARDVDLAARAEPPRRASERVERPSVAPSAGAPRRPEEHAVLRAEVAEVEAVVAGLGEALVELGSLERPLAALEQSRQAAELLARQLSAPRRADAVRLAALLERSQLATEDLRQALGRLEGGLRRGAGRVRRQLEQTAACAERLRLVAASSIFTSLERAAFDAARDVGRRVEVETRGGDAKLDSHVLTIARGALLHLVRNAVAHGAEPEAQRRARGKPAHGTICLSVERRGRQVAFTCRDDGAGIDTDAVRRLLGPSGAALSDEQVFERLLAGGVSTSGEVTALAGRGVGLDVARAAAEQLGGSVKLRSVRGQGVSVELSVPLSVAAVTAVAVECGGRTLSIPIEAVVESVRLGADQITRSAGVESVCHAGEVLPFVALSDVVDGAPAQSRARWTALIVRGQRGRVAVGVDALLGARSIVVRPLPEEARARAVVAGATLDALGDPELVLDGEALVAAVHGAGARAPAPELSSRRILVIDDSLTTRMLEQSILESAGYDVALATSGEEGLEKARRDPYALFLVDVEMPGIDGFTFVERARHDPALASVPAVLVSSRSAPEDFARGEQVGAHGYIVKDRFDQRELLGLIEQLVGG